jgi:CheY-like chemotaxis protein
LQQSEQPRTYHFYQANNGREALKMLAQYYDQIDVMIIDLVMDKMAGMDLLKFIVDKWGLDLGIFMVTAHGSKKDLEEAQLRGVRGFIDKLQLDFNKLSHLIETYLDLKDKNKAIDNGFYVEERIQPPPPEGDQKYVYVRWRNDDRSTETLYLGKAEEIATITLPNLRTNLDKFEVIGTQNPDQT